MKKTKNYRRIFSALIITSFLLAFTLIAGQAYAQNDNYFTPQVDIPGSIEGSVQITSEVGGEIQSTLLSKYIAGLYNYSFAVAGILAAIVLMAEGLMWLVSGGNQTKIGRAKQIIGGAVLGLIILFSSYIILNVINPELLEMKALSIQGIGNIPSSDSSLGCCSCTFKDREDNLMQRTCQTEAGMTEEACSAACQKIYTETEWPKLVGVGKISNFVPNNTCGHPDSKNDDIKNTCVPPPNNKLSNIYSNEFNEAGWKFQTGIQKQVPDMSPELAQILNCMRANLPSGVGEISSISDSKYIDDSEKHDNHLESCNTYNTCSLTLCAHSCQSCHYGGGVINTNGSYAVDFGDETNFSLLKKAAEKCDPGAYVEYEDNHVHTSVSECPKN